MTEPTTLCDITVVTTTVATETEARQLAQLVLQARLAACVQVEPITAYFPWQGALQEEREFRLVYKTAPRALHPLLALVRAHHPYVLPQPGGADAAGLGGVCRLGGRASGPRRGVGLTAGWAPPGYPGPGLPV